jgi:very-short-patch-repair endonuclease
VFTRQDAREDGLSPAAIKWKVKTGSWQSLCRNAYVEGEEPPTPLELAVGPIVAGGGAASGIVAGVLYGYDGVSLEVDENGDVKSDGTVGGKQGAHRSRSRRRPIAEFKEIHGVRAVTPLQALVDLAWELSDARWEQALESALRKELVTLAELRVAMSEMSRARTPGVRRMRRVLDRRGDVPPTESLLETLMVQIAREFALPDPIRQYVVERDGRFVARVDLAWPELGVFVELDGQHHNDQPVYDSSRETAVVAATGWLCGRFTWREVVANRQATGRRLRDILDQAGCRPVTRV